MLKSWDADYAKGRRELTAGIRPQAGPCFGGLAGGSFGWSPGGLGRTRKASGCPLIFRCPRVLGPKVLNGVALPDTWRKQAAAPGFSGSPPPRWGVASKIVRN
jgi:hypothetical protein